MDFHERSRLGDFFCCLLCDDIVSGVAGKKATDLNPKFEIDYLVVATVRSRFLADTSRTC